MKQWLRVLPLPLLVFAVMTFLDIAAGSDRINWISNIAHALVIGAIGCVGMYLIHKNILKDEDSDGCDSGCNCG